MHEKSISNRVKGPEFFRVPSKEALLSFMLLCLFQAISAEIMTSTAEKEKREALINFLPSGIVGGLLLIGVAAIAACLNKGCCTNTCKCCSYQSIPSADSVTNSNEHEMPNLVPHIDSI